MIFLPIKPDYAFAIKNGEKKVEFRKVPFRNRTTNKCVVYASSPYKKIIGYFCFEQIDEGSPSKIWEKYKSIGCIQKSDFDKYYQGTRKAYAIKISNFVASEKPIDPQKKIAHFSIPQSFKYLSVKEIQQLFSEKSDLVKIYDDLTTNN